MTALELHQLAPRAAVAIVTAFAGCFAGGWALAALDAPAGPFYVLGCAFVVAALVATARPFMKNRVDLSRGCSPEVERRPVGYPQDLSGRALVYNKFVGDLAHSAVQADRAQRPTEPHDEWLRRYVLRPASESFRVAMAEATGRSPAVEVGILRVGSNGFRVTAATGLFTRDLEREGHLDVVGQPAAVAFVIRAASAFPDGDWYLARIPNAGPEQFLFVLSSEKLTDAERTMVSTIAPFVTLLEESTLSAPSRRAAPPRR